MVIAFPRTIPTALKASKPKFIQKHMEALSPLRSGGLVSVETGPTLWSVSFKTSVLNELEIGEVRAFFDTLASSESFYLWDFMRDYPYAYRDSHWSGLTVSGSPFDGTGSIVSVSSVYVITIEDLPAGFQLKTGDYLAFSYGSSGEYRALHRVSANATANGSGVIAVEVRPQIRAGWSVGATVDFYRPSGLFTVIPDSYDEDIDVTFMGTIVFQAIQNLSGE